MGPLFSLLFQLAGAIVLTALAFCVFRFAYSSGRALGLAVAFVVGTGLGCFTAVLVALPIVGSSLESDFAVFSYLTWLGTMSLAGGAVAARCAAHALAKFSATRSSEAPYDTKPQQRP